MCDCLDTEPLRKIVGIVRRGHRLIMWATEDRDRQWRAVLGGAVTASGRELRW